MAYFRLSAPADLRHESPRDSCSELAVMASRVRRAVAMAIAFGMTCGVFAADSAWSVRAWRSDGLPDNTIVGLAQTADGFLWLAMPTHLARFDGANFDLYERARVGAGPDAPIVGMLRSAAGGLWIATEHGAVVYVSEKETRQYASGLPDAMPVSLTEDARGNLWIGYRDGSACRIAEGVVRRFTAEDGLPEGGFCVVASDAAGGIWWAKADQVGVYRDGRFETVARLDRLQKRMAAARDGGIWLCTGLRLFRCTADGRVRECGTLRPRNSAARANVLLEDRHGAVWIGTSPGGLFRYDGSDFESVPTSDPDIASLLEDREGNLWAGTVGGGLDRLRPRGIVAEGAEAARPTEAVRALCEDSDGRLWAATQDKSLVVRADGTWSRLPNNNERLRGVRVTAIASDAEGAIWVGTDNFALHRVKEGRFESWRRSEGLTSRVVSALLVSRSGDVWVAGEDPVSVRTLRDGAWRVVELPGQTRPLRAFAEGALGEIWIGGDGGSLWRVSGGRAIDERAQLQSTADIRCLFATSDGSVWIGRNGDGLLRAKDGRFTSITTRQGLLDDRIAAILVDGNGGMWFAASKGLFRIRVDELSAVADGRSARVQSVRFAEQGLPSMLADMESTSGALRARDGHLWFPMGPTLAVVDPGKLHGDLVPPSVLIKRVRVDNRTIAATAGLESDERNGGNVAVGAPIVLPPTFRKLEIDFTALSFSAPENVQFRCWLEGFDEGWVDVGPQRSMSYSRLTAGDYRFRVIGCGSDGVWNETGAAFAFTVPPLWWQRAWFVVVVFLLLSATIFVLVRQILLRRLRARLRVLEQQAALDRERARIARDLHDDLGARLTQLVLLNEVDLQHQSQRGETDARVSETSRAVRQVIKSLDETVWALNPRNDTLPDLIDYLSQFAVEFLRSAGIRCQVDLPDHSPKRAIPADARHHLFLVAKEALNNVVRHAGAREVRLRVAVTGEALEIQIEDNGHGFDRPPDDALADGLRNMRHRMAEIGGGFEIESRPGCTRVSLRYPWPPINTTVT